MDGASEPSAGSKIFVGGLDRSDNLVTIALIGVGLDIISSAGAIISGIYSGAMPLELTIFCAFPNFLPNSRPTKASLKCCVCRCTNVTGWVVYGYQPWRR